MNGYEWLPINQPVIMKTVNGQSVLWVIIHGYLVIMMVDDLISNHQE